MKNSGLYTREGRRPEIVNWPKSDIELLRQSINQNKMTTVYPERNKSTLQQLLLSTRPRRSPLQTVMNQQVNYSNLIPNNYTTNVNTASYYPGGWRFNINYKY